MSEQAPLYQANGTKIIKNVSAIIGLAAILIGVGMGLAKVSGSTEANAKAISQAVAADKEHDRINHETALIQARISTILDEHIKNHD